MDRKLQYRAGIAQLFLIFLILGSAMVPTVFAANPGNPDWISTLTPVPDLNRTGMSITNMTIPSEYQSTSAPITIFKAEVTASSLPGPRDMAFGPSVIGVSVDRSVLAGILIVIAVAIAGYYLYYRKRNNG